MPRPSPGTRHGAAAQQMEGTVTIGEAVRELGLEATPEEILAELRAARTEEHPRRRTLTPARWFVLLMASAVGGGVLAGLAALFASLRQVSVPMTLPATATITGPVTSAVLAAPGDTLVLDKNGPKARLDTLADVPDNRPVLCDLSAPQSGTQNTMPPADSIAFTNYSGGYSAGGVPWTLIKHDGHVYVRGWIADMTPAALRTSVVTIYTVKAEVPSGAAPLPVTLRLDNFRCDPGLTNDQLISAKSVQSDSHFTEPWTSR